jgi:hypothetical protein
MEEPAFLVAMQRIVSRIEIEHNLARRCLARFEEQLDEQALDRGAVVPDLVVT